jgi:3-phenylpropionate/cinnamic acid dioxygenase small subunit
VAEETHVTTASRTELRLEVEDFLYHEARLLDERRFHEWLDLFTEDLVYWMPTRSNRLRKDMANEIAQPDHLAYFNDDLTMLKGRVVRLDTDMAWAEDPPSRTQHMVYNVQIDGVEGDEIRVHCSFILYRNRLETEVDIWCGYRDDVLRRVQGQLKIARRKIVLAQNVITAKNLSVFF